MAPDLLDHMYASKAKHSSIQGVVRPAKFKDGKKHGTGTFTFADGATYEGDPDDSRSLRT
jgi:hypothetical protein